MMDRPVRTVVLRVLLVFTLVFASVCLGRITAEKFCDILYRQAALQFQGSEGTVEPLVAGASVNYQVMNAPEGTLLIDVLYKAVGGQLLTCKADQQVNSQTIAVAGDVQGETDKITVTLAPGDTIGWQETLVDKTGTVLLQSACGQTDNAPAASSIRSEGQDHDR